jgi:hypothetical protein
MPHDDEADDKRARQVLYRRLKDELAGKREPPHYELCEYYWEHARGKPPPSCPLDLMFVINARFCDRHFDMTRTTRDFVRFRLPEQHEFGEEAISSMDCRQLRDTLELLTWKVDGNPYCTDVRDSEWFADLRTMLELIRHRAYYLVVSNVEDDDVVNMEEYQVNKANKTRQEIALALPSGDSDDEGDGEDWDIVEDCVTAKHRNTNVAFVWDFNSMITHVDIICKAACNHFGMDPATDRPANLGELRKERILSKMPKVVDILRHRREYEFELCCNEADKRIYARRAIYDQRPSARAVLASKNNRYVEDEHMPKTPLEMMSRGTSKAMFRMNMDSAFTYMNRTEVSRLLGSREWEYEYCAHETTQGDIWYVRALNRWSCKQGGLYESLFAAYVALVAPVRHDENRGGSMDESE